MVVGVERVWQCGVAVSMGAVGEAVGPFPRHGLVEALHLPVGARPVWLGGEVADAAAREQVAERAVLDVAEAVIGQQPLGGDASACRGRRGRAGRSR